MGERRDVSLGLGGERCLEGAHIVYLYSDDRERKRTMARYLGQGLSEREKVLYLVHDISPEEMQGELEQLGLDVDGAGAAFDMLTAHYRQCPGEVFSPEYMLSTVAEYYEGAIREGFAGARGAGEMAWAAQQGRVDLDVLLEYEGQLNAILERHPLTTVCQYDVRLFSGQLVMDLLAVHPMAIVRGQVVKNPYFVAPDSRVGAVDHEATPA